MDVVTPMHRPRDPEPFCIGCGLHGPTYAEKKFIGKHAKPAPFLRVCIGCYEVGGWRLFGEREVAPMIAVNL